MKRLLLLLAVMLTMLASCKKDSDIVAPITQQKVVPTALEFSLSKFIDFDVVTSEPFTNTVYDSCTAENIYLSGTETYKIKELHDYGYFLYYEIDLTKVTGVGEKTGTIYTGGGKIINIIRTLPDGTAVGWDSYSVKYHCHTGSISMKEHVLVVTIKGVQKLRFSHDFTTICKTW